MIKRFPVNHYTDGRSAWKEDAIGLTRLRGIFGTIATTILLGGLPWWWPQQLGSVSISLQILISSIVGFFGVSFAVGLFYLRNRSRRSLDMKYQLHMIAHEIRDKHCVIKSATLLPDIKQISNELCDLIQRYFDILIPNKHIGTALRLARKVDGKTVYETVGRSGLNKNREITSEPLKANEGIARVLQDDKGRKGVLIYNDLEAAAKSGAFVRKENDRNFDEIETLMVAPVNGWDGEKKSMLGMLYITSDEMDVFEQKHTDALAFVSDAIASFYSELVIGRLGPQPGEQYDWLKQ